MKELFPKALEEPDSPPLNTYKNKEPFVGTVLSVERIVGPNATGETCHIVIDHEGKMPYWEGQSYGIIPPVRMTPGEEPYVSAFCVRACHKQPTARGTRDTQRKPIEHSTVPAWKRQSSVPLRGMNCASNTLLWPPMRKATSQCLTIATPLLSLLLV